MAVNLTPQYLEAEAEYKKAQTAEEKLECLKKMWTLVPKHKASEKAPGRTQDEDERPARRGRAGARSIQKGRRQLQDSAAGGRADHAARRPQRRQEPAADPADAGHAGGGAVSLHHPRTARRHDGMGRRAACSSSTRRPSPPTTWKAIFPAWCAPPTPPSLLLDLGDDDGPFAAETVLERLAQVKTVLVGQPPAEIADPSIHYGKTLLLANKIDLPGAADRLEIVREMFAPRFPIHVLDAESGTAWKKCARRYTAS